METIWHPLDKQRPEIRLLEIEPSADLDAELFVVLTTWGLKDAVANGSIPLSYVCGDPSGQHTITVNGISSKVGSNLSTFLRHMRHYLRDERDAINKALEARGGVTSTWIRAARAKLSTSKSRNATVKLWTDALCINQADTAEREHQVSLMGEIYGSA